MKRFKNSSDPKQKKVVRWKLKGGINWDMVEFMEHMTDEQMMIYFDKVEENNGESNRGNI